MIHELLSYEGLHGKTMRRLMQTTGKTRASIERQIEAERLEGWPIICSSHNNPRYYLASNVEIFRRFAGRTRTELTKKKKTLSICESLLDAWERDHKAIIIKR